MVYQSLSLDQAATMAPLIYKEKIIPLIISKALSNKKIPIYGDGKQIRNWIYADDCCKAIDSIVRNGID